MEKEILEILTDNSKPIPAKSILTMLHHVYKDATKSDLNKILYALEKQQKVKRYEGTPPLWDSLEIKTTNTATPTQNKQTLVLIDCDNSPCLREASYYAFENDHIYALASSPHNDEEALRCYNNYIPPSDNTNVVFKIVEKMPSIIPCMFAKKLSALNQSLISNVIIVSKDKVMETVAFLYKDEFNIEIIDNGWEGLKLFLE